MKKILAIFLFFWGVQGWGYSKPVVITNSFGKILTTCEGGYYGRCHPTLSGKISGFSSLDRNIGGAFYPEIDHIDGAKTVCDGFNCIRRPSSRFDPASLYGPSFYGIGY